MKVRIKSFLVYTALLLFVVTGLIFVSGHGIYDLSLFFVGYLWRVGLNHPDILKRAGQKQYRLSFIKLLGIFSNMLRGIKNKYLRFCITVLTPYCLFTFIAFIFDAKVPTYLVLIGSFSYDILRFIRSKLIFQK